MTLAELQQAVLYLFPKSVYGTTWTAGVDATGAATINLWQPAMGSPPDTTALATALASAQLAAAKTAQDATLAQAYQTARYGMPVTITATSGSSLTFPTDTATQENITKYLAVFAGMTTKPSTVPLVDASGALQSIAPADVQSLAEAILSASQTAFTKLMSLQAQVAAATTVTAVQAVVWS